MYVQSRLQGPSKTTDCTSLEHEASLCWLSPDHIVGFPQISRDRQQVSSQPKFQAYTLNCHSYFCHSGDIVI